MKRFFILFVALTLWSGSAWGIVNDSTFSSSSRTYSPIPGETFINAGIDRYTATQATVKFGPSGDYLALPAGFFGPGSDPFEGAIFLKGTNSDGSENPAADVSINRTTSLVFTAPPTGGAVPIEITQLSLVSSAPILVLYEAPDFPARSFFDVFFELKIGPQPQGMDNIMLENQNGGVFTSQFFVRPIITFRNRENPSEVYTYDPESMGYPPLVYSSIVPYPWTLSPMEGEFDPLGEEEQLFTTASGSLLSLPPLLERTDNNFMVEMNENGYVNMAHGNGFNNGEWFYYPNTNWWNVWWYDHPIKINRTKYILNPTITIFPRYTGIPSSVEIVYTYSTPQWPTWTIHPHPPLPSDVPTLILENQLIQRSEPLFQHTGIITQPITVPLLTPYHIPYYNPEWISVDIRGSNFYLNGMLNHVCFKPATRSVDFGDAPAPYPTLLVNNGARHTIVPGVFMGILIDAEPDGQPNSNATGDDITNLDDEDGVTFNTALIPGQPAILTIQSSIANALLQAWIDFNGDGDWAEPGEQISTNSVMTAGNNAVNFIVPQGATPGQTFARFRLSTMPGLTYTGPALNGEVEDYLVNIEEIQLLDYGDAPDPNYPTLLASNGARHINTGLSLGMLIDVEPDGQPNATATGDDINPPSANDEDGVWWACNFTPGHANTVKITVNGTGFLNAWIDFNADGDWAEPIEQVFTNVALSSGTTDLFVNVPFNATLGATFARFRFSTQQNLSYTGLAQDGEVEDYQIIIQAPQEMDYGDAPDPTFPTLAASNGARHAHDPNVMIFMGNVIDWELDGQPGPNANGDDLNNLPDEDGVSLNTPLIPGMAAIITVSASIGGGALQGWIDFNQDGDWNEPGEQIFTNVILVAGPQQLNFAIPPNALLGNTYARFRYSTMGNLSYYGCAPNGEVEDYRILIGQPDEFDWGDLPDPPYPTLAASNGPNHKVGPLFLGILIDSEINGQPHANALGDDLNNLADEDGIVFTSNICPGQVVSITVTASQGGGLLQGWIDLNADGDFNDAGEQIFTNQALAAGINFLTFTLNPAAQLGMTFTRFRLSTIQNLGFTGAAPDGEVEDYQVMIVPVPPPELDFGDAPDPTYPTLSANNGARHQLDGITFLGNLIDSEADGQPTPNADGDDLNNLDDEDGVTFMWPMVSGNPCKLKVTASVGDALLNCWIDFNGNGSWADPDDHVFVDLNLLAGDNYLTFITPQTAKPGPTYARFRFSHQPALSYSGLAFDGEVEDYTVEISEYGDMKWQQPIDPLLPGMHANDGNIFADDWICNGGVITDIHWWGNYEIWQGGGEKRGSGINHFLVNIYTNSNCLPNIILKSYIVPFTPVLETNTGLLNNEGSFIYKYDFLLPEPFIQIKDTTYWLSVIAISNDPQNPPSWRWQEANRWLFPIHCGAASNLGANWQTITWQFPPLIQYEDLAFVITSWVVDTLYLQDIDVTHGQDNCYDANKVMIVAGDGTSFTVQNGSRAIMVAGEKINYLPTTKVFPGGYMYGSITETGQFCNALKAITVTSPVVKPYDKENPAIEVRGSFFKIYPNPTKGTLTLELTDKTIMVPAIVEIYGMIGDRILREKFTWQNKHEISLVFQPSGVYILRIITGKEAGTVKIIKQ